MSAQTTAYALAQTVRTACWPPGFSPRGNLPAEHSLHEVARMLRTVGDTIGPPLPHGRHQAYVEQEERVARRLKAEHLERDRTREAA